MTSRKIRWRDAVPIHPAAEVFPLASSEEMAALKKSIREIGLQQPIKLWEEETDEGPVTYLLDGRNRLDAVEALGWELVKDGEFVLEGEYIESESSLGTSNPTSIVVALNIHRRHLTKAQRAALIVKAVKAGTDFAKVARSVERTTGGRLAGSTKDPVKEQVVAEAKRQGISKRTAEQALADDETEPDPEPKPKPKITTTDAQIAAFAKYIATRRGHQLGEGDYRKLDRIEEHIARLNDEQEEASDG